MSEVITYNLICNKCGTSHTVQYEKEDILYKIRIQEPCPNCDNKIVFIPRIPKQKSKPYADMTDEELIDVYWENEYRDRDWSKELSEMVQGEWRKRHSVAIPRKNKNK